MKKKFLTIAIGAFLALQIAQAEDEPRRVREANADREVRRENSRPGERERDRAPDERRFRGDREGDRRPDRETPPGVRFRHEGDRPAHGRPPFPREADGRERPQRFLPQQAREGGPPSPERLRRSQQLNAELRDRMQLLEQRLERLEAR